MKGAAYVLCIDNDPQALTATGKNAARNGVSGQIKTLDAADFELEICSARADVILANILAGTLVKLAPALCSALKPGGQIALSGILPEQADEVRSAYRHWLQDIEVLSQEGWILIKGKRK